MPSTPVRSFTYTGAVHRMIDGDTVVLDLTADPVDVGFGIKVTAHTRQTCRLLGINTREIGEPGGPEARDYLARLLIPYPLRVVSVKLDPHGRALVYIHLPVLGSVADVMTRDGYAAAWDGRGDKPVPPWPLPEPTV